MKSQRTPLDMDEVRGKLREKLGDGPAADILASQIAVETGDGRGAYNYNIGNRKASDKPGVQYQLLDTYEIENGKRVDRREPFTAHASLDEGLDQYIEYLDRKGLLDVADAGSLDEYNAALKRAGYYTDDETQYGKNMHKRYDAWRKAPQ